MLHTAIALLAAAVLLVPLAHRLGAGAIVGYLAAGVVVGPYLLGVVPDAAALSAVSELGIAMLLFVIGLGLEPPRVWEMRRAVFGAGVAQVALCGAALFGLALTAGLAWQAALLVGLALAQSSTAIAMQLMTERNIIASPTGRIAFGVHLFQDLFALPLIALVGVLAHAEAAAGEAKPAWLMAAVLAGAVVVGRLVLRRAFRLIAATDLREVFTAASLLLVLGMAGLLQWAGFSLALGAFIAGMLLADSEYRKALETDIEPFKGLLLGLFFLTVGASLDLAAIAARWPVVLGIAVGMVAVKSAMLLALAPLAGVPRDGRLAFVAVLAQGSEFGIVVLAAAHAAGLLTGVQSSVLAPAIVLSMLFSPLALALADRLDVRRQSARPAEDAIAPQAAPVIIAGFGRVGQIVGRVLFAQGVDATVLDRDPQQIELIRRFGYKVFYGDATRLDLLRAAGAGEARVLVNAIDDVDASLELTDAVRAAFPQLVIVARARNVRHAFELKKRGVTLLERETLDSSLRLARGTLQALGVAPYEARLAAEQFRRHNVAMLEAMYEHYGDEERMVGAARAGRDEFESAMQRDRALRERAHRDGWQ
jgi:glutathione-regulated potassium-efflux system ancillary protein KefC